jgi:probable rRNA maturation factor
LITIAVKDEFQGLISSQILTNTVETLFKVQELSESSAVTIRITDDDEIQNLNRDYRGFDIVTDVLSFLGDFNDPDLGSHYLGDIVISYPQAKRQANDRGHDPVEELQLLVVHGLLHLLGYDHAEIEDKNRMWILQNQILDKLGLNIQVEDEQEK